jgi:hypothetical protein
MQKLNTALILFSVLAIGCVSARNTSTERTSATPPGPARNVFEDFLVELSGITTQMRLGYEN